MPQFEKSGNHVAERGKMEERRNPATNAHPGEF